MDLTKTDIKRAIQRHLADSGLGRGWKKHYSLRDGKSARRLCDLHDLDAASDTASPGQVIDVEAVVTTKYSVKQEWIQFWIGEGKIWASRNEINDESLSDETLIFER